MKKNIIQLNGRLYDSETGKMVSPSSNANPSKAVNKSKAKLAVAKKTNKITSQASRSIDGFGKITNKLKLKAKQPTVSKPQPKPKAKTIDVSKNVSKPSTPKPARKHPNNQIKSKLQHTSTLRRSTVKKPVKPKPKVALKSTTKPAQAPAKRPVNSITNDVKKSPLITRFARPEPSNYSTPQKKSTQNSASTNVVKPVKSKPESKTADRLSTKELLIANTFAKLDNEKRTTKKPKSKRQKVHHHVKKHSKTASILAGGMAVLLIGLYVIYLNVPNMAIKFAASRAGFDASLPHYSPSGYSFHGPIQYQPGQVAISFKSNSDKRRYSVIEQPSQWDSEAVYDNYVRKQSDKPPYTIQDSGLTIYLFGDSSAAWVNGGKFFAINGKGSQLSSDQLLNIATSL